MIYIAITYLHTFVLLDGKQAYVPRQNYIRFIGILNDIHRDDISIRVIAFLNDL